MKDRLEMVMPEGFIPEVAPWIWSMQDLRRRTKRAVEGLSQAQLELCPPGHTNSIGSLLYHIAGVELGWLFVEVLEQDFPNEAGQWFYDEPGDSPKLFEPKGEDVERHFGRLDYSRGLLLEAFARMDAQDFRRLRSLPEYEVSPQWVLYHLLEHEAAHQGQILSLRKHLPAQ